MPPCHVPPVGRVPVQRGAVPMEVVRPSRSESFACNGSEVDDFHLSPEQRNDLRAECLKGFGAHVCFACSLIGLELIGPEDVIVGCVLVEGETDCSGLVIGSHTAACAAWNRASRIPGLARIFTRMAVWFIGCTVRISHMHPRAEPPTVLADSSAGTWSVPPTAPCRWSRTR